jgi:hypothetical protein
MRPVSHHERGAMRAERRSRYGATSLPRVARRRQRLLPFRELFDRKQCSIGENGKSTESFSFSE